MVRTPQTSKLDKQAVENLVEFLSSIGVVNDNTFSDAANFKAVSLC